MKGTDYKGINKTSGAARIGRERYLSSPLVIDTEYVRYYTEAHKKTNESGLLHPIERRAECHAYAMEHITPTIFRDEELVGRKTRFVRGAVPYTHYACGYILRELKSMEQEAQDTVTEVGSGGGMALGKKLAASGEEFKTFGKKFLIRSDEASMLEQCAEYWEGKCMQDTGDRLWKPLFAEAQYIEDGWKSVLYTAPHDPAPDGRCVLDFESALTHGLEAIAERCEKLARDSLVTVTETAEKAYFWRACARVLRATIVWARNYGAEARRMAETEADAEAKARLLAIAERCEVVPARPPRDFADAVQMFWFVYLAGHLEGAYLGYSPGRFDQYMWPAFAADAQAGAPGAGLARTMRLLECLRVKMTEVEYVASFAWEGLGSGNLFQNMILGGLTEHGTPADNALSYLVVQSAINCRTTQPTLSVWYDPQLSDQFLMKAIECVKTGVGFPAWFNLQCYVQHELEATGLPLEVIRKHAAMGGCTEPVLGGMSYGIVQPGFINLCKVLELAMHGGEDPRTHVRLGPETPIPASTEELIGSYNTHLEAAIRNWQQYWSYAMAAHRNVCTCVFASALTRDCIGAGKGLDDGGALVNCSPTTLSSGLVNVVNSLAAVHTLVDEQRVCTFEQLRQALLHDWAGADDLHARCLRAPKWGNNDDRADRYYVRLFGDYCALVRKGTNFLGKPFDPSMLAISTHAPFGRACCATPDGRTCAQTLADGVTSPFPGTDVSGPFSVLLSAGKVDHTRIRGGLHNMKLHPTAVRGSRGSRKLLTLISSYFRCSSSFQLQFNIVDTQMLRDAQLHPENYRDLIVRVAGFSAYFVELARPIQDEVIARTEHELPGGVPGSSSSSFSAACDDDDDDDDEHGALSAVPGTVFDVQDFTLHDGPGVRTTIFLKGCPLRCRWCCNPESQSFDVEEMPGTAEADARTVGRRVTAGEVVADMRERTRFLTGHATEGGVTLSGGEPLAQADFAHAVATLLDRAGIPVAIETSGQWCWDRVANVFPHLSLVYFDVKAGKPRTYRECTGVDGLAAMANLARVVRVMGPQRVVVSLPCVHGFNDTLEEAADIAAQVLSAGVRRVRILPFHGLGDNKYVRLGREVERLEDAVVSKATLDQLVALYVSKGLECSVVGAK